MAKKRKTRAQKIRSQKRIQAQKEAQRLNTKYVESYVRAANKRGSVAVTTDIKPYSVKHGKVVFDPSYSKAAWREFEKTHINLNKFYTVPANYVMDNLPRYEYSRGDKKTAFDVPLFSLAEQKKLGKSDVYMLTTAINERLTYANEHHFSIETTNRFNLLAKKMIDVAKMKDGFWTQNHVGRPIPVGYMPVERFARDFRFIPEDFEREFNKLSKRNKDMVMRSLREMAGNVYGDAKSYQIWTGGRRGTNTLDAHAMSMLKTTLNTSYIWQLMTRQYYESKQGYSVRTGQNKWKGKEMADQIFAKASQFSDSVIQQLNRAGANDDYEEMIDILSDYGLYL